MKCGVFCLSRWSRPSSWSRSSSLQTQRTESSGCHPTCSVRSSRAMMPRTMARPRAVHHRLMEKLQPRMRSVLKTHLAMSSGSMVQRERRGHPPKTPRFFSTAVSLCLSIVALAPSLDGFDSTKNLEEIWLSSTNSSVILVWKKS